MRTCPSFVVFASFLPYFFIWFVLCFFLFSFGSFVHLLFLSVFLPLLFFFLSVFLCFFPSFFLSFVLFFCLSSQILFVSLFLSFFLSLFSSFPSFVLKNYQLFSLVIAIYSIAVAVYAPQPYSNYEGSGFRVWGFRILSPKPLSSVPRAVGSPIDGAGLQENKAQAFQKEAGPFGTFGEGWELCRNSGGGPYEKVPWV